MCLKLIFQKTIQNNLIEMVEHIVETNWMGQMQFKANVQNHTIVMDATERGGGNDLGPIPKPFILTALTGCAGMELMSLIKKYNLNIKKLNLKAKGKLTDKIPYYYTSIHLIFEIETDEDQEKISKFVARVMNDICGVSIMLKKILTLNYQVNFK